MMSVLNSESTEEGDVVGPGRSESELEKLE